MPFWAARASPVKPAELTAWPLATQHSIFLPVADKSALEQDNLMKVRAGGVCVADSAVPPPRNGQEHGQDAQIRDTVGPAHGIDNEGEKGAMRPLRLPRQPTEQERQEHEVNHVPYPDLCVILAREPC